MPGRVEFWFEFASTYSYPAAMRIETLAARAGVPVAWQPFLLGPIFQAQGWRDSPFNLYPAKGRYMWRDLERLCAKHGLPYARPEIFPQRSILAARLALLAASPLEERVASDGQQVREGRLGPDFRGAGEDPEEGLGDEVLGGGRIPAQAEREAVDGCRVLLVESLDRVHRPG